MPLKDNLLIVQATVTKTATFTGAALDLKDKMALSGMGIELLIEAAPDQVTGDETYTFKLDESADNSAWNTLYEWPIEDSSAATLVAKELYWKGRSKRYIRLVATLAGTTPSVVYSAHVTWDVPT